MIPRAGEETVDRHDAPGVDPSFTYVHKADPGALVYIVDDNGDMLNDVCLYLQLSIPGQLGLGVQDLVEDVQFIDERFRSNSAISRSSHFFYTLPEHWHHALLVGGRIVHLNAGFYSVVVVDD